MGKHEFLVLRNTACDHGPQLHVFRSVGECVQEDEGQDGVVEWETEGGEVLLVGTDARDDIGDVIFAVPLGIDHGLEHEESMRAGVRPLELEDERVHQHFRRFDGAELHDELIGDVALHDAERFPIVGLPSVARARDGGSDRGVDGGS